MRCRRCRSSRRELKKKKKNKLEEYQKKEEESKKTAERKLAKYEQLLNEVMAADPEAIPAIGPENKAEQAKAEKLLETKGDYFAE